MRTISKTSGTSMRIRQWTYFSQFRRASTKLIPIENLGWKKLQASSKMISHQGQNYQYKLHFCNNEISKSLPIPVQFLVGHIQVLRPTLTATNNQKPNHISKISINKTSADNIIMNITDARLENRWTKTGDLRNTGINWIFLQVLTSRTRQIHIFPINKIKPKRLSKIL